VEPALRELIQTRVGRGKVECRVSVTPPANATPRINVNEGLLLELAEVSRKVRAAVPDARPLSVGEVLGWPGVLGDDRSAALREACVALVHELLEDFVATRSREGGKLAQMLVERVERMKEPAGFHSAKAPRSDRRLPGKTLRPSPRSAGRRRRRARSPEIALFGVESRRGRGAESPGRAPRGGVPRRHGRETVGKRLDFLMQELNREANTLGSKSVSKELSEASLEFKLLIEQMREQIQNIE